MQIAKTYWHIKTCVKFDCLFNKCMISEAWWMQHHAQPDCINICKNQSCMFWNIQNITERKWFSQAWTISKTMSRQTTCKTSCINIGKIQQTAKHASTSMAIASRFRSQTNAQPLLPHKHMNPEHAQINVSNTYTNIIYFPKTRCLHLVMLMLDDDASIVVNDLRWITIDDVSADCDAENTFAHSSVRRCWWWILLMDLSTKRTDDAQWSSYQWCWCSMRAMLDS